MFDPIPAEQPSEPLSSPPVVTFEVPAHALQRSMTSSSPLPDVWEQEASPPPLPRKLCVRHQRMADEGTNLKLQQSLDAYPLEEREAINAVWSIFSSSSHPRRALILQGLLTMCCFSQLSLLTEQLAHLIRIDPFTVMPREVSLQVLRNLDATSLCRAAQVSKQWKGLADDDILWRGICEQHIGQKCHKCGWGLPRMDKKRPLRTLSTSPCPTQPPQNKRCLDEGSMLSERPLKRQRSESTLVSSSLPSLESVSRSDPNASSQHAAAPITAPPSTEFSPSDTLLTPTPHLYPKSLRRPWKTVYSERLLIERNWRRGRHSVRTLQGHTDGVMCLQFSETLSHPSFPILITGSYDRTARVWNMETGAELQCLRGHTRAVRALQFDEVKLITGSMDHSIRVWDWRSGRCVRTLMGHTEGVICLHFDSNVLASGGVDATIKVWNLRTGEAFVLRGHHDWVNSVQLWDSNPGTTSFPSPSPSPMFDSLPSGRGLSPTASAPQIDPGKMLFSASDDGTIRLWDLTLRTCVRQFTGHVGQVQSVKLLVLDEGCDGNRDLSGSSVVAKDVATEDSDLDSASGVAGIGPHTVLRLPPPHTSASIQQQDVIIEPSSLPSSEQRPKTVLVSGSLDNTIKLWDIDTAKVTRTLFGHIEGVWSVAGDELRLVSGSHDRSIKVWNREEGQSIATLVGHRGAVTCVALGEDKIVSGSDDGDVKVWSFSG